MWLNMDRPNNLMVIESLMFLDGVPDWDEVTDLIQRQVVDQFPVFHQRPESPALLGQPWWVDDEGFSLDRHVVRVTLPPPGDDATLQAHIEAELDEPLNRGHPMWRMHLIDGYGSGSAVLLRIHHSLADGIALTRVLLSLTEGDPAESADIAVATEATLDTSLPGALDNPEAVETIGELDALDPLDRLDRLDRPSAGHAGDIGDTGDADNHTGAGFHLPTVPLVGPGLRLARDGVGQLLKLATPRGALDATRLAIRTTRVVGDLVFAHNPDNPFDGRPGGAKRVVWTQPLPLLGPKQLGRLAGATLNDVLMSAVAAALHRYQLDRGENPVDLVTMVPVNVRPLDEPLPRELGNRFALVFFHFPSALSAPLARLAETKRRMDWIKRSPEAVLTYTLINAIGRANPSVERLLVDFFANKAIGVTTNVAGPRSPRTLAGVPLSGVLGWVPGSGRQTLGVCIFTYAGTVRVGFMCDAEVVPDPERLLAAFEDELDHIVHLARPRPRRARSRRAH
ncbi:WS/DGAT domain-containing protein [Intrasporangium sp.]|uniref:WS/DGAT domain-containing protein n=1 Tax=Intrasporangium sp. TaxID=1925024 RepID=UPI00293AC0BE|nr:WS/DGAT domain-containing protein [Intrasporangium sp.]MDV3221364.1 WS/DGAT domain-containing protein [Intrasporangium sp.]